MQVVRPVKTPLIIATVVAFMGTWLIVTDWGQAQGLAEMFGGLVALLVWLGAVPRLYFSPTSFGIRNSIAITKWLDLEHLCSVSYRGAGEAGRYVLRDALGHSVSIPILTFPRDNEWAGVIMRAASATGASVDARARRSLERADGTGNSWMA